MSIMFVPLDHSRCLLEINGVKFELSHFDVHFIFSQACDLIRDHHVGYAQITIQGRDYTVNEHEWNQLRNETGDYFHFLIKLNDREEKIRMYRHLC